MMSSHKAYAFNIPDYSKQKGLFWQIHMKLLHYRIDFFKSSSNLAILEKIMY